MVFVSEVITIDGTEYTITDEAKVAELKLMQKIIRGLDRLRKP